MPYLNTVGLLFDPDLDEQTAITIYLPVALRTASLLWLRVFWARQDEGAPRLPMGDIRSRIRIYTIDELTDTVALGGTWDNDVTIADNTIVLEQHYYDIDISSVVDADTSLLYVIIERTGTSLGDTLAHEAIFLNAYTLLTQTEEPE